MKLVPTLGLLVAMVMLAGCAEKPQVAATRKADGKPWEASSTGYVASGWKAGDQASWEQQLKMRSQGQDEYSRAPAKP